MSTIHLLVLIHGMWGHPGHLAELHRIAEETYSEPLEDGGRLEILLPETNRENSTYDGIDWGGERVTKEVRSKPSLMCNLLTSYQVLEKVEELEKSGSTVTKLSVTGYSLGGLLARYVVGCVHVRHQSVFMLKLSSVQDPSPTKILR